eukprot:3911608-Rhodomonas_salina.2
MARGMYGYRTRVPDLISVTPSETIGIAVSNTPHTGYRVPGYRVQTRKVFALHDNVTAVGPPPHPE